MKVTDKVDIKVFAALVGKTSQAIYQQAKTRLKPYIEDSNNGKKIISLLAAVEVFGVPLERIEQLESESQPSDFTKHLNAENSDILRLLQQTIDTLESQLKAKDQQIELVQTELQKERAHGREISDKLAVLTSQAQSLQAQQLQALTVESVAEVEEEPEQPPRRTLWQRIFRK